MLSDRWQCFAGDPYSLVNSRSDDQPKHQQWRHDRMTSQRFSDLPRTRTDFLRVSDIRVEEVIEQVRSNDTVPEVPRDRQQAQQDAVVALCTAADHAR